MPLVSKPLQSLNNVQACNNPPPRMQASRQSSKLSLNATAFPLATKITDYGSIAHQHPQMQVPGPFLAQDDMFNGEDFVTGPIRRTSKKSRSNGTVNRLSNVHYQNRNSIQDHTNTKNIYAGPNYSYHFHIHYDK